MKRTFTRMEFNGIVANHSKILNRLTQAAEKIGAQVKELTLRNHTNLPPAELSRILSYFRNLEQLKLIDLHNNERAKRMRLSRNSLQAVSDINNFAVQKVSVIRCHEEFCGRLLGLPANVLNAFQFVQHSLHPQDEWTNRWLQTLLEKQRSITSLEFGSLPMISNLLIFPRLNLTTFGIVINGDENRILGEFQRQPQLKKLQISGPITAKLVNGISNLQHLEVLSIWNIGDTARARFDVTRKVRKVLPNLTTLKINGLEQSR